jgi:hypothetical protein
MPHRRLLSITALVLLAATSLHAQSEVALREYFEGKSVTMKLAMPGTEDGVDIYPTVNPPLNYPKYAGRLKEHGTSIHPGESVMVTKIKVKSDLIEFHLGGGGYGTFGDETSSSVSVPPAPKTKREKNLEVEIKRETDPIKKRDMKEELDDLKAEREREDARNRAEVADAQEAKKQNIRQRRLEGGSRFNLRYKGGVPATALTPESVKAALAEYVTFDQTLGQPSPLQPGPEITPPAPKGGLPRKGMLAAEVDRQLGKPEKTSDRKEGRLTVNTRVYSTDDGRVSAEFVEGVLIRFTVTSN